MSSVCADVRVVVDDATDCNDNTPSCHNLNGSIENDAMNYKTGNDTTAKHSGRSASTGDRDDSRRTSTSTSDVTSALNGRLVKVKYRGIGPLDERLGIPTATKTSVEESNQREWYKCMFRSLHDLGKPYANPSRSTSRIYAGRDPDPRMSTVVRRPNTVLVHAEAEMPPALLRNRRSFNNGDGGNRSKVNQRHSWHPSHPTSDQSRLPQQQQQQSLRPQQQQHLSQQGNKLQTTSSDSYNSENSTVADDKQKVSPAVLRNQVTNSARRPSSMIESSSDRKQVYINCSDVDNPESIPEWARIERSTGPPPSHRVSLTTSAPVNSQTIPEALLPRDTTDRKSTTSDHGCDVAPAPIGHAVAVYPFRAQSSRELSFDRGEAIVLLKHLDRNWFEGQCRGLIGSFPASYVEVLSLDVTDASNKRIEGLATATYSFLAETNVELSFKKGDKVVLIRRIDSNWYEGRIGDRRGIVPVNYLSVERQPSYPMSDIAKSDRTSSTPGPTSSSGQEHSRNVNSLLNKLPTAEEKQTSSSDVIYDRQPSLSTAEMSNSGETSEKTRDVVSSYQPRGTQNSDVIVTGPNARSLPCGRSSNDARHLNVHGRSGNVNSSIANGAPYLSDKHQRLPEYRVLYNYRSRQPDELDIAVDDVIHVSDICDDGWYWGTSQRTKKFGSFPGNFVQPV